MTGSSLRTLVNGGEADCLPVSDRGLHYGDGLFETVALVAGGLQFWQQHIERLCKGCERLQMAAPDAQQLWREALALTDGVSDGVLKIIVTRGRGGRGYRVPGKVQPVRIMQLHAPPGYPAGNERQGVRVRTCELRLGRNPALAGLKHLNRLEQVMARMEWDDARIAEGLLLDSSGMLVEGTMSNVFLVRDGCLSTPRLDQAGVAGVMRAIVLELAGRAGLQAEVREIAGDELEAADELFLCNSLIGIWPVSSCDSTHYATGQVTRVLQERLHALQGNLAS